MRQKVLGLLIIAMLCFGCLHKHSNNRLVQTNQTSTTFSPGIYSTFSNKVLDNPSITGVIISARWRDLEPQPDHYNWNMLDKKIGMAKKAHKQIILNIMTCGVNVPDWVINNTETFSFVDKNPHHPTYGKTMVAPLYWDPVYLKQKQKFVEQLGKRYGNESSITGVMVSFVGTINNDWFIPKNTDLLKKGYSTAKMVEVGEATIDMWAHAFKHQALKMPIGISLPDKNNTITTLATKVVEYGYERYGSRFFAQVNALCTKIPKADGLSTQDQTSPFFLLMILKQHPHKIGFQMIGAVSTQVSRVDNAGVCTSPLCTLNTTMAIALTYKPWYVEIWHQDGENPEFGVVLNHVDEALAQQQ